MFLAIFVLTAASAAVTIDVEQRVIHVIENQKVAKVCLVKSGPSSLSIMAFICIEEIIDSAGSQSEHLQCTANRLREVKVLNE